MSELWSDTPVTVLPELERMLVTQASRRVRGFTVIAPEVATAPESSLAPAEPAPAALASPGRRPLRISRRSTVLALLVALVVGSAVAAVRPWSPLIGNRHAGHPTVSQAPPSATALRLLGVLRGAQAPRDRDGQVRSVLHVVGPQLHGVRVGWIRNLEPNVAGAAVTLVPVEAYADVRAGRGGGFLCVLHPLAKPGPGASLSCWSPAQIAHDGAVGIVRDGRALHVLGLVPDGVASVSIELADGRRIAEHVRRNFFDALAPGGFSRVLSVRWRDANGRPIRPGSL